MTLVHIAVGITPHAAQSYLVDDFGDLCQLHEAGFDETTVAAARYSVESCVMTHAMRVLGE